MGKLNDIANEFERLILEKIITWEKVELSALSPWGQKLVTEFLDWHKINWLLGSVQIEGAVCLKLDDPTLQYLDIYPSNQFTWFTNNHHESLRPDDALAYLLKKAFPGTSSEEIKRQIDTYNQAMGQNN